MIIREAHFATKLHKTQRKRFWKRQDSGYFWWNREGQGREGANDGAPATTGVDPPPHRFVAAGGFALEFTQWHTYFLKKNLYLCFIF